MRTHARRLWLALAALFACLVLVALAFFIALRLGALAIPLNDLRERYGTEHSRYLNLDGVDLHVDDRGEGPVVILVHGHFQSQRIWNEWADSLSQEFRVLRIDMPPYGLSGPDATGQYSPQRVEQLIAMLVEHEGIEDFSIGGSSTGSAVAMRYSLAHPDQINSLILVNAPLVPVPPQMQPRSSAMFQFLDANFYRPIHRTKGFYRELLGMLVANKDALTEDLVQETYDMHRKRDNAAQLEQFTNALRFEAEDYAARSLNTQQQLASVSVPTLVMWGGAGTMLPVSIGCEVARTASPEQPLIVSYAGAGHFLPIESPRAGEDLAAFLTSLTEAGNAFAPEVGQLESCL